MLKRKKADDPEIQTAQWFLDFLSDDLERMTELDLAKRVVKARHYLRKPTFWIYSVMESDKREPYDTYLGYRGISRSLPTGIHRFLSLPSPSSRSVRAG